MLEGWSVAKCVESGNRFLDVVEAKAALREGERRLRDLGNIMGACAALVSKIEEEGGDSSALKSRMQSREVVEAQIKILSERAEGFARYVQIENDSTLNWPRYDSFIRFALDVERLGKLGYDVSQLRAVMKTPIYREKWESACRMEQYRSA